MPGMSAMHDGGAAGDQQRVAGLRRAARTAAAPMSASALERVTIMPVDTAMQQRRDLGDQAVADGQQRVGARARRRCSMPRCTMPTAKPPTMLTIDDDDAGDRVALDELGGTVHRAVEVGLGGHLGAALAGLRRR